MENQAIQENRTLVMGRRASRRQRLGDFAGRIFLFTITSMSAVSVLFIFFFIARDAIPFFFDLELGGFRWDMFKEFFSELGWYPSARPGRFGALSLFYGTAMVTVGAILVAVPLGVSAAVCLSDVLPFSVRQVVKPVIEILAAIPSVAYGFFALVVFAPLLQERGGHLLAFGFWLVFTPLLMVAVIVAGDLIADRFPGRRRPATVCLWTTMGGSALLFLILTGQRLSGLQIDSGANAFNVSIILGLMALPTVVSVSEDALQAAGRELREGSYALGATRAETIIRTIIPAAVSGILAAVILGVMRAVGETMVVWMASGNAAQIPQPFYDYLQPIRTMTATIAGDMGEADHVTGSDRYHVLFALALCLLVFSFIMNLISERIVRRSRRKLGKE